MWSLDDHDDFSDNVSTAGSAALNEANNNVDSNKQSKARVHLCNDHLKTFFNENETKDKTEGLQIDQLQLDAKDQRDTRTSNITDL